MIPSQRHEYPVTKLFGLNELPDPHVDVVDANNTYYGYAPLGSDESANKWLIVKKVTTSTVTKTLYSNGSMEFNVAWADRATLTYKR